MYFVSAVDFLNPQMLLFAFSQMKDTYLETFLAIEYANFELTK